MSLDGISNFLSFTLSGIHQFYFEITYSKKDINRDCVLQDFRNNKLGCNPRIHDTYVFNVCRSTGAVVNGVKVVDSLYTTKKGLVSSTKAMFSFYLNAPSQIDEIFSFFSRLKADNFCDIFLYSLKVYSRPLTDTEIKQNYEYEQSIDRTTPTAYTYFAEEKSYGIGLASQLTEEQLKTFRLSIDKTQFVAGLKYCKNLQVEEYTYFEILDIMETAEWKSLDVL